MVNFRGSFAVLVLMLCTTGQTLAACDSDSLLDRACMRLADTWTQGGNDLFIPFHAYHLRSKYSEEKIDSFRENNWGLGYGRSRYDNDDNWDSLYTMAFLDSHGKPQYMLGYTHEWMIGAPESLHAGLGYSAFLTARSDLYHYVPLPGILPVASINYNKFSINSAYIPGGEGNGNIFFLWSRIGF